jgi:uncharacterized protein (DUF1501 family)
MNEHVPSITRRRFLFGAGLAAAGGLLPLRIGLAAAPGDRRLLVVILRGGLDGLAAVVPYTDPRYRTVRGALALPETDAALKTLDGDFGMHASLAPLADLYAQGELLFVHAVATPYRERSHFDAQNLLESGGTRPHLLSSGWLNRAAAALQPEPAGIAIGASIPLVLRGDAPVTSWAPSILPAVNEDFLSRVMRMYEDDALLAGALADARMLEPDAMMSDARARGQRAFVAMMERAAAFMRAVDGPRLGAIDIGGWDTHANQGRESGRLANALRLLADGLTAYRREMGEAWSQTAVLVVTEFGRTVQVNGSGGSDHGTGSVAFLLGGSVAGGRMLGDWPGLARLHEGRDLLPANDLRALLKGTLQAQLGLDEGVLREQVFPQSEGATPLRGLLRT